jgi:hypothetical protein
MAGCPISRVLCEKWGFSPTPSLTRDQRSVEFVSSTMIGHDRVFDHGKTVANAHEIENSK